MPENISGNSGTASIFDLAYPTRFVRHDFALPYTDNDTIVWCGEATQIVDANGVVYDAPSFSFSDPWYHCRTCVEADVSDFKTRLSLGAKFCPECGTALDWEHMDRDPDGEKDVQAAAKAKLAQVKAEVEAERAQAGAADGEDAANTEPQATPEGSV